MTSWSVSFNRFCERRHGWFSRRSTIKSLTTFETNYTGFRFGSESRSNFVYLVFCCLRGETPPYLTEMLSLVSESDALWSHRSAARGDLIIPTDVHQDLRPSWVCGLWADCMEFTPSIPERWRSVSCYLQIKITFLAPNLYVYQLCLLTRLYDFGLVHFCPQATRHSRNGYLSVRERLQMIFRIAS